MIDARPGAASALGSQIVAQATPDGYTLLFNNVGVSTAPLLAQKPLFDPLKDFAPVIIVGTQSQFIVVHPSLPGTLKEFVQYAKANPGKVNFGSSGVGGSSHLSMEYFKSVAGIEPRARALQGQCAGDDRDPGGRNTSWDIRRERRAAAHQIREAARARGFGTEAHGDSPDVPTAAEAGLPRL